jgi:hypothetical protein
MRRRWVWVLVAFSGWALPLSCSLDLGPVLEAKPKDGGAEGDAPGNQDVNQADVYVLPPGCLNAAIVEAQCDPLTNAGCFGGLGCDTTFYTKPRLACLTNDGLQLGEACNQANGPYCAGTLTCTGAPGICTNFCCIDDECPGGFCVAFDINLGTLGHCSNAGDAGTDAGSDGS